MRCLAFENVCSETVSEDVSSTKMVTMSHTSNTSTDPPEATSNIPISMSSYKTWGALIGLLAAALVVVTMGWIVSCVCLVRRSRGEADKGECCLMYISHLNSKTEIELPTLCALKCSKRSLHIG